MQELDPVSEEIKEVYAQYGLAMYQAQCVERQLAILLATKYGPGIRKITRVEYDEILQSLFAKTFGGLINKLRKTIEIPDNFEKSLKQALEYRNWLAHHYFWERAGHFMSTIGRTKMIEELQEIVDFLHSFDHELISVSTAWAKKNGVSEDVINQERERLIQEAENVLS